jgi:hypothetical protein
MRDLSQVGPLTLQADAGVRPQVMIPDAPWGITAHEVSLNGLDVVWTGRSAPLGAATLVHLKTQRFRCVGCRFVGPQAAASGTDIPGGTDIPVHAPAGMPAPMELVGFSAVTWEPLDRRDPQAGVIEVEETILDGVMHGVTCRDSPRQLIFRQVLKMQRGSAVVVEQASARHGFKLVFDTVTLRQTGPLVSCSGMLTEQASASLIELAASNCVFDLAKSSPLVELRGPNVRDDWPEAVRALGNGCLLPPGAILLAAVDPQAGITSVLESDELQFEGLFLDDFEFAGPPSPNPRDSALVKTNAPRNSAIMPGVHPDLLPGQR